jgi:hypothetical protein
MSDRMPNSSGPSTATIAGGGMQSGVQCITASWRQQRAREWISLRLHTALKFATGRVEASFASKLVATLEPDQPVIDKYLLLHFGLSLPTRTSRNRIENTVEVYEQLCRAYQPFISSTTGSLIRRLFDEEYPDSPIAKLKKIDFVLWQIRPQ